MKKILILSLIILFFFVIKSFGKIYRADLYYKSSQRQLSLARGEMALKYARTAIKLNPNEPRYRLGEAKIFLTAQNYNQKSSALKGLEKARNLNPKNLVTIRNSVPLYSLIAVNDIYIKSGKENLDSQYFDTVKKFFVDTKKKYPNDVGVYVLIAGYEKKLGFDAEYKNSIKVIRKLRPDLLQWYEGIN